MTAQIDLAEGADKEYGGQIYFFAAKSEKLVQGMDGQHRAVATFASKGHDLFAHVHGTLVIDNDRGVIDRLWGPVIDSWYKDGKDDPDLASLRYRTGRHLGGGCGIKFKAVLIKLTGRDPGEDHQKKNRAEVQLT